jgi:hypothetical protein
MSYQHNRNRDFLKYLSDLAAHLAASLQVKGCEGFVQQKDLRLGC